MSRCGDRHEMLIRMSAENGIEVLTSGMKVAKRMKE